MCCRFVLVYTCVCMYVCMYVCMNIWMYYVYPSQSIQDTSIVQFPLLHRTHARRDSAILAKLWCRLQLCSMQGQRSFVWHESTQEWCSVTCSGRTAKPTTQPLHTTSPSSAGLAHQGSWTSWSSWRGWPVSPRSLPCSGPDDPSPFTTVSVQWQTHSHNHSLTWPQRWRTAQLLSHLHQSLLHGEYMEDGMGIRKGLTIKCVHTQMHVCADGCTSMCVDVWECMHVYLCAYVCESLSLCLWTCTCVRVCILEY